MHMDPKHVTLNNLLLGRLFRIPDYQRAYAWGTKQRKDLFSDIEEVAETGREHFMATVVCLARDKRRIAADEFLTVDIVDGQQRLTTFVILLKAIERALDPEKAGEGKIKREIAELLVKGDDHCLVLLQTNHDSSSVFLDYLRQGEIHEDRVKTAADRNLVDAARDCEGFVKRWHEKRTLIDLVAILRNSLSLIYHEIHDEAIVYRVFEVLNSRGLDVKWIDKLKSQLMALIFATPQEAGRAESLHEMQEIWKDIYRVLGLRADLGDEALRFAGAFKLAQRPNRVISQSDAAAVLTDVAGTHVKTIVAAGEFLRKVVEVVNRLDSDVRRRAITRIMHARFLAAAILLRGFPKEVEEDLLGRWERLTFRIFCLAGADTRRLVGEYVRLAYDVLSSQLDETKIRERLAAVGKGYSINEVLKKIEWDQCYEGWTEELRYLLFRYDEHLAREAGEKFDASQWNKIWGVEPSKSIEHIEPQSSGAEHIHHLGNLTMLPPEVNSALKDKPPAIKAETYITLGLAATRRVGQTIAKSGWDEASVHARTKLIEDFVRQEWAD
ncbi:hypothetical protein GGR34_003302 [Microvirga flocculans]|uniref:DUF262 domain-containing protein n=2 Tax=Microvirga flocculans TaxID=217168 RepID=A0A7W6IIQ5_9HYPH|nr:DUF262 domain-containing protein [Microvirga flocculans]MBB4041624.1 hypothetical protein [Microvirga flocculans]